MPISVERLPNEPIVIATITGQADVQDILGMFEETNRLTMDIEGRIYRITHVTTDEISFGEIMRIIREAGKGGRGSTSDPNIKVVFVGTKHWIDFTRQAMSQPQFGGVHLNFFPTMEEALEFVRNLIKVTTSGGQVSDIR